jgi:hypothetical protein
MKCRKCNREAILYQPYSGQHLCREHAILDIETKAKRTIRQQRGMQPGDHIAVILNGNSAENALLFFLRKLTQKRRDIQVSPISSGTTDGYNDVGGNVRITVIASATMLEDASATALRGILRGDPGNCLSGYPAGRAFCVITPFCHIPSEEIALYARINGLNAEKTPGNKEDDPLLADVKRMLVDYTARHPAAPHAILNICEVLGTARVNTDGNNKTTGTEQFMKKSH